MNQTGEQKKVMNQIRTTLSYDHPTIKVALHFSGVNFVSLNFTDYVSMALCMGDNRAGDTSNLLDLPQEIGLARRGSF